MDMVVMQTGNPKGWSTGCSALVDGEPRWVLFSSGMWKGGEFQGTEASCLGGRARAVFALAIFKNYLKKIFFIVF